MSADHHDEEWRFWFPEHGETEEDARTRSDRAARDPERVAGEIAEAKWYRDSPDYFTELRIELVDPMGGRHTIDAFVESVPSFRTSRVKST